MSGRGRPRTAGIDARVRDATLRLMSEGQFDSLTVDRIALLARTSKASIYRRWETRDRLLVDVVRTAAAEIPHPPVGATPRDDLTLLLEHCFETVCTGVGTAALHGLTLGAGTQDRYDTLALRLVEQSVTGWISALLRRWGSAADPRFIADLIVSTGLIFRRSTAHTAAAYAARTADLLLHGLLATPDDATAGTE